MPFDVRILSVIIIKQTHGHAHFPCTKANCIVHCEQLPNQSHGRLWSHEKKNYQYLCENPCLKLDKMHGSNDIILNSLD